VLGHHVRDRQVVFHRDQLNHSQTNVSPLRAQAVGRSSLPRSQYSAPSRRIRELVSQPLCG
jgi:hypothetical protein